MVLLSATVGASVLIAWARLTGAHAPAPRPEPSDAEAAPERPQIFAAGVVEGRRREISLRFEVPGRVQSADVREGDTVMMGEVLAELDCDVAQLRLAEARTQLKMAVAERDRLVADSKRANLQLSREEETIAQGKVTLAEAALRRQQLLLDKCKLRAPSDGIVLRAALQVGELTGPEDGRELLIIADHGAACVRAFVEELDALEVAPGQRAQISVPGRPDRQYQGTVSSCAPSLRPKSQRRLKPGERVDVRVREAMIDLENGAGLLIGLPVEVFIQP
jgi:RND family efflux transporter MFP subunit